MERKESSIASLGRRQRKSNRWESIDREFEDGYMVRFIDDEVRDLKRTDLVPVDDLGDDKKCWVPKSINRYSIQREEFEEYYDRFDAKLETDFEVYSDGLLFEDS